MTMKINNLEVVVVMWGEILIFKAINHQIMSINKEVVFKHSKDKELD